MFGKKLNEEFTIKYKCKCYKAYFKKSGIRVHALYYMDWNDVLVGLLTGEVTIINDWARLAWWWRGEVIMEVRVIFMDATAEKVFKNVDNIYTKGGLLVIREGDWLYKYPLEHIFSIVHKHGAHWGSNAWKKKEFTK